MKLHMVCARTTTVARGARHVVLLLLLASPITHTHCESADGGHRRHEEHVDIQQNRSSDHPRVFVFGENPLYPCFRVPGLVSAPNGTLLAFAEARRYTGDGCIPKAIKATGAGSALAVKRSDDGGRTWYPKAGRIVSAAGFDESAVFDVRRETVTLLYPTYYTTKINAQRQSSDLGNSWTGEEPLDLGAFNDSLVGPGRGLQLRSGPHAGRLLFAVHHGEGGPNTSAWKRTNGIFISDDGGHSWRLGATLPGMDEAQLAESGANGEITIASRVHSGPTFPGDACLLANGSWSTQECTLLATSHDGGETFGPITRNFDLFQPPGGCAPGLAADPEDLGAGHLFFSNPASRTARENMVVRRSTDSGRTWTDWRDPTTVVYSGPSAYSCLAPLFPAARWGHQRVGLLYERDAPGCTGPSCAIHFAPISTQ